MVNDRHWMLPWILSDQICRESVGVRAPAGDPSRAVTVEDERKKRAKVRELEKQDLVLGGIGIKNNHQTV